MARQEEEQNNADGNVLTVEAVENFRTIYKNEFKQELTLDEAQERSARLLNLFRAVYCRNSAKTNI